MGHKAHRSIAPRLLSIGVISVSSTRTIETDISGQWITKQARLEDHKVVAHDVVTDAVDAIRQTLVHLLADFSPHVLIITGGTGISPNDVTIEAVQPLFTKELTAFGPVFAQLSYDQVDAAALLSRATAGVIGKSLVFCLPGSLKACKLACKALIFPELGHLYMHTVGS